MKTAIAIWLISCLTASSITEVSARPKRDQTTDTVIPFTGTTGQARSVCTSETKDEWKLVCVNDKCDWAKVPVTTVVCS